MIILGINIGTIRTGVCILDDGAIQEKYVHNYETVWSDYKLRSIIRRYKHYVQKYRVNAIVVKIPPLKKHSKAVMQIIKKIEMLAKDYDCLFDLITKKEMKYITGCRSTAQLIKYTVRLYPELLPFFVRGEDSNHSYYRKLYEAVLAAHVFQERQRTRALQIERGRV
jgi:RNase H-fold protein (predicted Holliday junction resolvase)